MPSHRLVVYSLCQHIANRWPHWRPDSRPRPTCQPWVERRSQNTHWERWEFLANIKSGKNCGKIWENLGKTVEKSGKNGKEEVLVGGWALPLWKIWVRQLGWWNSQYMESHKNHVPNQQPDIKKCSSLWIDLRENLNRKPWFLPSNIGVSGSKFPIIQFYEGEKTTTTTYQPQQPWGGMSYGKIDMKSCLVWSSI